MMQLVFGIVCVLLALAGYGSFRQWQSFQGRALRTEAVLTGYSPDGVRAMLAFTAPDGETRVKPSSNFPRWAHNLRVGDTVEIVYSEKKVFGASVWNIVMVRQGETRNPYGFALIVSVVFWLLALGALLAALLLG